jgi:hypothetical protein
LLLERARSFEKLAYFIVGSLREIAVPRADGEEGLRRFRAHYDVHLITKILAHIDDGNRTATTISPGFCLRSASTAARIVDPVASPSSIKMAVRPAMVCPSRPPR